MSGRIHKKTTAVFLGLIFLIAIMAGVAWVSLMNCAGFFRRSYHTIILGDKNYVDRGDDSESKARELCSCPMDVSLASLFCAHLIVST